MYVLHGSGLILSLLQRINFWCWPDWMWPCVTAVGAAKVPEGCKQVPVAEIWILPFTESIDIFLMVLKWFVSLDIEEMCIKHELHWKKEKWSQIMDIFFLPFFPSLHLYAVFQVTLRSVYILPSVVSHLHPLEAERLVQKIWTRI